ncbi:hypothetical protein CPB97_004037, partial [Podila verticillata]
RAFSRVLKSATSFLALSLIALQVVAAQIIPRGIYAIEDVNSGKFLGIGPTPDVYPPLDAPRVEETKGGTVIISATVNSPPGYNIVSKEGAVFASARKEPQLLAVESAGQNEVVIKLPNKDEVFTSYPSSNPKFPEIFLQPANGSRNQRYRFLRVDRDLYHGNRFYNQESC